METTAYGSVYVDFPDLEDKLPKDGKAHVPDGTPDLLYSKFSEEDLKGVASRVSMKDPAYPVNISHDPGHVRQIRITR